MPNPDPYTEADGRLALRDHVRDKAVAARQRYPILNAHTLPTLLQDRTLVRYPVTLAFDNSRLQVGDLAYLQQLGETPSDGYALFLHPAIEHDTRLPLVAAYYLPSVNYGEIVSSAEAELFGAVLNGMPVDEFYSILCALADQLWDTPS
jgi:hypothetical protein